MNIGLIILIIQIIIVIGEENACNPYAVRLSLGKYYTSENNGDDMINILFNTDVVL